jgi:hypothetical protein
MHAKTLTTAAVIALGSLIAPAARAISGCSTSNLNGNYVLQLSGSSSPSLASSIAGVAVPASLDQASHVAAASAVAASVPVGGLVRLFFDGNGLLIGNSSVSLSGMWLQGSVSGQYTVNQDCTAQFSLTDPTGATGQFSGVVVGESAFVLETDRGTGLSGLLKRGRAFCQSSDISGTFGIQYSGSNVSSVGIVTLDGQGGASATETRFGNGASSQVTSTGLVTVNPDCSATITLTSSDVAAHSITFAAVVSADNKQLLLLQADPGTVATGTMTAQ